MSAADIIGILGFALHAAHKLYEYGQRWLAAPEELQALLVEVNRVQGLLQQMIHGSQCEGMDANPVLDVLRFHPDLIEQIRRLAEASNTFVDKMTKTFKDGSRHVQRTRWTLKASDAKDLTTKFQALYSAVSAIYAVNAS